MALRCAEFEKVARVGLLSGFLCAHHRLDGFRPPWTCRTLARSVAMVSGVVKLRPERISLLGLTEVSGLPACFELGPNLCHMSPHPYRDGAHLASMAARQLQPRARKCCRVRR